MTESTSGQQLSWDYYSEPRVYQRESSQIFAPNWHFFAHGARTPKPKDAIVAPVAQDSILMCRGDDDCLRAYHNICRHRGAPLLCQGTHEGALLRCPYHGWTYDDRGRLVSAPRFNESSLPHQPDTLSLFPLEVSTSRGMAFVRCETGASSLDAALAPINTLLDDFHFDTLEFDSTLELAFECNWKLYIENWLESYHFPWMHKSFTRDVNIDDYSVDVLDRAVCHKARPKTDHSVYAGAWVWLWPLTAWNSYDGGLSIERVIPDGPHRTRLEFTFLFEPSVNQGRRDAARQMCATVTAEDGNMCEKVHRAVMTGRFVPGPLSPTHERAIGYFHQLLRQSLNAE